MFIENTFRDGNQLVQGHRVEGRYHPNNALMMPNPALFPGKKLSKYLDIDIKQ